MKTEIERQIDQLDAIKRSQDRPMTHKPDLLADYQRATRALSFEDRQTFAQVFIGALSCHVSPSVWSQCLESAKKCVMKMHKEESELEFFDVMEVQG